MTELIRKGIYVIVAAGNEAQDACNTSPASNLEAITVGASSIDDSFAYFSNKGKCVNIVAPGVEILSTVPGNKTAVFSGTSMAAPNVAGIIALKIEEFGEKKLTPKEMKNYLVDNCSKGILSGVPRNTPNCLSYSL